MVVGRSGVAVRRVPSAAEFLDATVGWRCADPVGTNVIGSVAQQVAAGRRFDDEFWFVAEDAGVVVGGAMWTPPHLVALAAMPPAAVDAIGDTIATTALAVPGVVGPPEPVHRFAARLRLDVAVRLRERTLVLGAYRPPATVPGAARPATLADLDLVSDWMRQFATDTGLALAGAPDAVRAVLPRMWLWQDGGRPVSLAGHAPIVTTPSARVGRVGPVFTPSSQRGRGYASAVTAAVVEHLLPHTEVVMLFTDAANPTSNGIYERLGFAHVGDVVELVLRRASA